jgi:adenylate cyclase
MSGRDPLTAELEAWLVEAALGDPDMPDLFGALCAGLRASGLPLDRALLVWPTLHPLHVAEQLVWRPDGPMAHERFRRGAGRGVAFSHGPLGGVIRTELGLLRRRLDGPDALIDFDALAEMRDEGFTDYLAAAVGFSVARLRPTESDGTTGVVASWATRRESGFSDADVAVLRRLMPLVGVSARIALQNRLLANIADAYLGRTVAPRVLSGQMGRGDGERFRAVLWYADLRDSTRRAQALGPEGYLALLNGFYDATAGSVIAEGGEVLAFIGDAVLAVFPFGDDAGAAARAAGAAVDAARAATDVSFGVAVTEGDVLFGNVGVPERLSFTVVGEAVNRVQRMEAHTKTAGVAALATEAVAAAEPDRWVSLGPVSLPDVAGPVALYARKPV